ncbi:GNAT family N-acetyltransferase [Rhodoferax aquaticus]|uniref:GNAT family N-acetyltransferase n=1 Tax=Rhodoferax aquaticus TaxID=2527691 RepID=A0A515EJV7_9BURK|nr:GNAT family N-acetyltransferase [Rhodoferax aquaticus]QDL52965.1 GNAT family N-acetyltransferase [Rhodoferax aquaticus]
MSSQSPLALSSATPQDWPCLERMMQFYNYDRSEWCPVEFAETGQYALRPKAPYWATPSVKPYVARVGGKLAGFAVMDQECVHADSHCNLGYFFLARHYRGQGRAQSMFTQLLAQHPGRWEIYNMVNNAPAAKFWPKAIAQAGYQVETSERLELDGLVCQLYRFTVLAHPSVLHQS